MSTHVQPQQPREQVKEQFKPTTQGKETFGKEGQYRGSPKTEFGRGKEGEFGRERTEQFTEGQGKEILKDIAKIETIKANIGLSDEVVSKVGAVLYNVLADEFLLGVKASNFAYNVCGPRSTELRTLFKSVLALCVKNQHYTAINLRELGLRVPNIVEVIQLVRVEKPREGEWPSENDMLKTLLRDQEHVINLLRKDIDLAGQYHERAVEDFLIDLLRSHKKQAFCLRSQLEPMREPTSGRGLESM